MIFAELDANGWVLIVGAIFFGLAKVLTIYLDYKREKAKIARDQAVATKVQQVKVALDETHGKTDENSGKLDNIAAKVEEVHKATNSMKDQIVEVTAKEAYLRGGKEERQRATDEKQKGE